MQTFFFSHRVFLKWTDSRYSRQERWAPLLLLPVELRRERKGSKYALYYRDDDFGENLALQKRLENDFAILLPDFPDTTEWMPSDYFEEIQTVIKMRDGWEIDPDGLQLGFFSFADQLIIRDLEKWPESELEKHPLCTDLLQYGFPEHEPKFPDGGLLDELLQPRDIIQVTDADASQMKVIEEVRKGSSLVVQGPPGTGKSQTITNIIASAICDNKTVLFMAEKMAALSVVHRKLKDAGLEDACLELHSGKARKSAWAKELKRTLDNVQHQRGNTSQSNHTNSAPSGLADKLEHQRDKLNQICSTLHTPTTSKGFSPFEVLAELIKFQDKILIPQLEKMRDALAKISRQKHTEIIRNINRLLEIHPKPFPEHPLYGVKNISLAPFECSKLQKELADARAKIEALVEHSPDFQTMEDFATAADLHNAPAHITELLPAVHKHADKPNLSQALDKGCLWEKEREDAHTRFTETALESNAGEFEDVLAKGAMKGISALFTRLGSSYHESIQKLREYCREPLPKNPQERLALLRDLLSMQQIRKETLEANTNTSWNVEQANFLQLKEAWEWYCKVKENEQIPTMLQYLQIEPSVRKAISEQGQEAHVALEAVLLSLEMDADAVQTEHMSLKQLSGHLKSMELQMEHYREWVELCDLHQSIGEKHGLQILLDAFDGGSLDAASVVDQFRCACAQGYWIQICKKNPGLTNLHYLHRHELVEDYIKFEKDYSKSVRKLIYQAYLDRTPRGSKGPMAVLNGEANKSRSHKPIRTVIKSTAKDLQKLKPVFLMSPISIAKFLPPDKIKFDLLIIDEASQVRPEKAFGAILRTRQIVVVGDQKQLPPTSFFERMDGAEDEPEEEEEDAAGAEEMESIISLCEARGLPSRMLEWHYRSKDPSLIQVSNKEFYDSRLVLLPSHLQHDDYYGLKFTRVPGVYSRGKKRTNYIEADAVVDAIARHARETANFSLGIATFSSAQSTMIDEVLEHARRSDEILDKFIREREAGEEVFIKSIENVQGDERDVIMISVGYGPDSSNGTLTSMQFGPVNQEGGERRLNVLFTRARLRCEVFASFGPEDMDTRRTSKSGPRILKRFLEFASSGQMQERHPTGQGFDSPFEEDVAAEVEACGFYADPQVGTSGFRIDIGVRSKDRPGQYILAVECDGATYHSSAWARERDHLRQQLLEGSGWKFHRIWSTDWFHNRKDELDRLKIALEDADQEASAKAQTSQAQAANSHEPEDEDKEEET